MCKNKLFQLKLKIAWFKDFLGFAVDQVYCNQEYPLTSYYFWPRIQAWEQLKLELDSKPGLTQQEKTRILDTAGGVMNYWLSYRNTKTAENLRKDFYDINVFTFHV